MELFSLNHPNQKSLKFRKWESTIPHLGSHSTLLGETVLTVTNLINRLQSRVSELYSPTEILATFFPNVRVTNNHIPGVFKCFVYINLK